MKILFVSPSVSRLFTGVYEVEKNLALEFIKNENSIEIHGIIDEYTQNDIFNWLPIEPILYKPIGIKKIGFNPTYLNNLNKSNADIGHIHSLWSYTSYALFKWSKTNNKPYVLSANAYLFDSALKQSKYIKKLALKVCIDKVIKNATCIHVNTFNEYTAVRSLGYKNPISIISNGVQTPNLSKTYPTPPWQKNRNTNNKKILLYLSRIHPQKGIDLLIESWKELEYSNFLKDWHLVIVGFQNNKTIFEEKIINLIDTYNLNNSVTILPGQYDDLMKTCYANSSAFILPSHNEGASIAALNALAFSKPVIITEGCNIPNSFENGAAIKIETNIESIKNGILTLIKMSESDRDIMGQRGRLLVQKYYSWKSISCKMLELYSWLTNINKIPIPDSVIID